MKKIQVELIGQDGNIFNLVGLASKALKRNGESEKANEMCGKVLKSDSYNEALNIISEYVDIV